MELTPRIARENEYRAIMHLLASNQLPTADIYEKNITFFVGLVGEEIVATIGIERYENEALVRSLCVKEGFKNQTFGAQMLSHLLSFCDTNNIETLYLLTTTAEHYFRRYGFEKIAREEASAAIKQTREFQDICPISAVVMKLTR